jgi:hypothetical protein
MSATNLSLLGHRLFAERGRLRHGGPARPHPDLPLDRSRQCAVALSGQSAWVAGYLALYKRKAEWWMLLPPLVWLAGVFLPWVNDDYANRVIFTISPRRPAQRLLPWPSRRLLPAVTLPRQAGGHLHRPERPLLRHGGGNRVGRTDGSAGRQLRRRCGAGNGIPADVCLRANLSGDHGTLGEASAHCSA